MYKKYTVATLLLSLATTPGCVGFKSNSLSQVSTNDINVTTIEKVKVFSRWEFVNKNSAGNDSLNAASAAIHKNNFEKALAESNCCLIVEGPTEADVVVDGKAYNEFNSAAVIPALITGFTFGVIPSWATVNFHISAEVKSNNNLNNYDIKDSMTMVQWLPMFFIMPFKGTAIKAEAEVNENTYRTLVLRIMKEGYLHKS